MGGVMFASVFIIVGGDSLVEAMVKDFDLTANGVIIIWRPLTTEGFDEDFGVLSDFR